MPIAVWIGLRPRYSQRVQAVAQFVAAFPVNLMFPLVVYLLVTFKLNANFWLSPQGVCWLHRVGDCRVYHWAARQAAAATVTISTRNSAPVANARTRSWPLFR